MKKKKLLFWGIIVAAVVLVLNVMEHLFRGFNRFSGGRGNFGHGPGRMETGTMQPQGGMGRHQMMMNGTFQGHGGGFHWVGTLVFLMILIAALVVLFKWLRKKTKTGSMQQFIDTALVGSTVPVTNQNANILDQWEKNVTNQQKEDV